MAHYKGSNLAQIIRQQSSDKAIRNREIGAYILRRASELPSRTSEPKVASRPPAKPSLRRASGSRLQALGGKAHDKAQKFFISAREYGNKASAQIGKKAHDFKGGTAVVAKKAASKAGAAAHKAVVKGSIKAVTSMGFGHPGHFKVYHDKENNKINKKYAGDNAKRQETPSGDRVLYDEGLGEVIKSGIRGYKSARLQQQDAYNKGARTHRPGLAGVGQGIANRVKAIGSGLNRAKQFTLNSNDKYGNNVRNASRQAWNRELQTKNKALMDAQAIRDETRQLKKQKLQLTNPDKYKRQQQSHDIANAKKQFADRQHADKVSQIAQGTYKRKMDAQTKHDNKLAKLRRKTELADAKNNLKASKAGYIGNSAGGGRSRNGAYAPRPVPYHSMLREGIQDGDCWSDYLCRCDFGIDLNEELYGDVYEGATLEKAKQFAKDNAVPIAVAIAILTGGALVKGCDNRQGDGSGILRNKYKTAQQSTF